MPRFDAMRKNIELTKESVSVQLGVEDCAIEPSKVCPLQGCVVGMTTKVMLAEGPSNLSVREISQ